MCKPRKVVHIEIGHAKKCNNCKIEGKEGMYLEKPDDPLHQEWICQKCINKGTLPIVKFAYLIGAITRSALKPERCIGAEVRP